MGFVLKEQLRTIDLFWKNLKSPRTCKNRAGAVEVEEGKRGQTSVAGGLRPGPLRPLKALRRFRTTP